MTLEEQRKIVQRQQEIHIKTFRDVIDQAEAEDFEEEIELMIRVMHKTRMTVYELIEQFRDESKPLTCWDFAKIFRLAVRVLHKITNDFEYNALGDRLREEMSPRV